MDLKDQLKNTGISHIQNALPYQTVTAMQILWSEIEKHLLLNNPSFDNENAYVLTVLDASDEPQWPPEQGRVWPGSKQKTTESNLFWKTVSVEKNYFSTTYTIQLTENPSLIQKVIYPKKDYMRSFLEPLSEINRWLTDNIGSRYFPQHKITFSNLTYISGAGHLPEHTDGDDHLDSVRYIQVLNKSRKHIISCNQKVYDIDPGQPFFLNAFLPHRIDPEIGFRLTFNCCFLKYVN